MTPAVHRDIDVAMTPEEVWPLVGDGAGWADWLVDDADVVVEPGCDGTVVDEGERKAVHIDEVVPGERVTWSWWPAGHPEDASTVRLVVLPAGRGAVVRITETHAVASARRWPARATLLASARLLLAA